MSLWFGYEWEIAASAVERDGSPVPIPAVLNGLETMVVENMKHVDGENCGFWLESGGRFYRDGSESGLAHQEYATPECSHPDELLRHSIAADRMMLHLAGLLRERMEYGKVMVSKSNVSHASALSWGAHENYEASRPVPEIPMLAWLASRFVLTGSGGLDVTYPGIRFTLSPRVHFFSAAASYNTQSARGLHNVGKARPYGKKHRVHVIAGDGNRSALSTWLKFGCTALVVRMLDANRFPPIELADPVAAAKTFALDPDFTASVATTQSRVLGALDIQHQFLDAVAASCDLFPDWASQVIAEWRRVLQCLGKKRGWRDLSGDLDWPGKLELFERVLDRTGWTWEKIDEVNARIDVIIKEFNRMSSIGFANQSGHTMPFSIALQNQIATGLGPDLFAEFHALKQQLSVVDARYMELGDDSLHDRICRPSGRPALYHLETPADPLELPSPELGRAAVRAGLVRKLGWKINPDPSRNGRTYAAWTGFFREGKLLSMPDVEGVTDLTWRPVEPAPRLIPPVRHVAPATPVPPPVRHTVPEDGGIALIVRNAIRLAGEAIDSGEYEFGISALERVCENVTPRGIHLPTITSYWKHVVRIQARRQREIELTKAAAKLESQNTDRLEALWELCNAHCLIGLAGHRSVRRLSERVAREMENRSHLLRTGVTSWKSHMAQWHIRNCRPRETLEILEPTLVNGEFQDASWCVKTRILTHLADAGRMLGEMDPADQRLTEAEVICRRENLQANLWDLVMPGRARLLIAQGKRKEAHKLLAYEIMPAQRRLGMPGWLRTFILIARITPEIENRRRWIAAKKSLTLDANYFSGYASCPRMTRILDHWHDWCWGRPDPAPPADAQASDFLWGV